MKRLAEWFGWSFRGSWWARDNKQLSICEDQVRFPDSWNALLGAVAIGKFEVWIRYFFSVEGVT
jgi:hypothetical protein